MSSMIQRKLWLLVSALLAVGCVPGTEPTSVADREAINREMPLIAEYEDKRSGVKKAIAFLVAHEAFDQLAIKKIKEVMNIEFVYYEASLVSLARGAMGEYRSFVHLADLELERVKVILQPHFDAIDRELSSGANRESAPQKPAVAPGHRL